MSTSTATRPEALTYSRALRPPTGTTPAGMGHTDATDPGARPPVMGTASEEENPALQGMPFAKTGEEAILPGQSAQSEAAAADEAGQAKDTEKSGTGKTGDASSGSKDDKKPSGIDLSGMSLARSQKAADTYASLSDIHQTAGSGGSLHAIG